MHRLCTFWVWASLIMLVCSFCRSLTRMSFSAWYLEVSMCINLQDHVVQLIRTKRGLIMDLEACHWCVPWARRWEISNQLRVVNSCQLA